MQVWVNKCEDSFLEPTEWMNNELFEPMWLG